MGHVFHMISYVDCDMDSYMPGGGGMLTTDIEASRWSNIYIYVYDYMYVHIYIYTESDINKQPRGFWCNSDALEELQGTVRELQKVGKGRKGPGELMAVQKEV